MARVGKDLVARAHLDDLAEIHDGDAVGDVLDHRHVVRDEEIGDAEFACSSCSRSSTRACTETSSAETLSSATISFGASASARAMQMRWRWPPENSCG